MKSFLVVLALCCTSAFAQNLPPGTREADDKSQEQAVNAQLSAAEAALEKGDFTTAIPLLKTLSAAHPKDGHLLYDLGFAEEHAGDEGAAAEAYARAASAAPEMAEPRIALGLLNARAGKNEEARSEFRSVLVISSAAPDLRARALRALAALDESSTPDAARDELLEAVKLTSETPEDVAMSGRLAGRAGDTADAEAAYRHALAADPNNLSAAISLSQLLLKSGRTAEAATLLLDELGKHKGDPQLTTQLAAVYGQTGKPAEGAALLQQERAADPQFASNAAATRMLARLDSLAGQDADAASLYAQLIPANAADPLLLDEYGGVLVKLGRFNEAQTVFSQALGKREAFPFAQNWGEVESHLAFAASKNHNPRLALQALALRATVLPNSPSSLFLQAISYDALHQMSEAAKAYRAFLAVANGKYPDQEFQARHRLVALEHTK